MSPTTHPRSDLLDVFASGAVAQAPALTIAAHLETCAACRARVRDREEIEGDHLESLPPTALGQDAIALALAGLDGEPPIQARSAGMLLAGEIALPAAVAAAGLGRRRYLAPGIWAAPVKTVSDPSWRAFILRTRAGTVVPTHGHPGGELIAVLSGVFQNGEVHRAGDFVQTAGGQHHRLKVRGDGPCVCLIAVQGRVQWRGWAKVLSPLLGL